MAQFDLQLLSQHLVIERDDRIDFMGMQTLYERYFLKHKKSAL